MKKINKRPVNRVIWSVGKKTVLRPLCEDDIPLLQRGINDQETRKFLANTAPLTLEQERGWFKQINERREKFPTDVVFAVETRRGRFIGVMGLHRIHWIDRVAHTGSMIFDEHYRGRGFGTDAKMLVLDYAFNQLNLEKVCSTALSENGTSVGHNKRCGYRIEGTSPRMHFRNGRSYDETRLGVFREQWLPLWKKYKANIRPLGNSQ